MATTASASEVPSIVAANAAKSEGNLAFAAGDTTRSLEHYEAAIAALVAEVDPAVRQQEAWVSAAAASHSNAANACLGLKKWERAVEHCHQAIQLAVGRPGSLAAIEQKARFRLATAHHEMQRPFEAFVEVVRLDPTSPGADSAAIASLKRTIARAVGIAELDDGFGVKEYATGLTAIARDRIAADSNVFVEGQLILDFEAADGDNADATTETRVEFFVLKLLQLHRESETRRRSRESFEYVRQQIAGSWPRKIEDVDGNVLASVKAAIAKHFVEESKELMDEITHLALQCRYNCFHHGFFRACALVNHGCRPNTAMKFSPGRSMSLHAHLNPNIETSSIGVVALRACRAINPGEVISVKYLTDFDFIVGVLPRRELLRSSWLFTCECDRCLADLQETAVTEWVKCQATPDCGGFLHLPSPGYFPTEVPVDPASRIPDGVRRRTCKECGVSQELSPAAQEAISSLRRDAVALVTSDDRGSSLVAKVHAECWRLRESVSKYVHNAHWAHTICSYVFCVRVQHRVDEVYSLVESNKMTLDAAAAELGLMNARFSPEGTLAPATCDAAPRPEVDVLGALRELCLRLSSFYPDDQLWALHVAIVRSATLLAMVDATKLDAVSDVICGRAQHLSRAMATSIAAGLQRTVKGSGSQKALKVILKALK